MSKHTSGLWELQAKGPGFYITTDDGFNVAVLNALPADARRMIACVNGCDGFNPLWIHDLVEASEAVLSLLESQGVDTGMGGPLSDLRNTLEVIRKSITQGAQSHANLET